MSVIKSSILHRCLYLAVCLFLAWGAIHTSSVTAQSAALDVEQTDDADLDQADQQNEEDGQAGSEAESEEVVPEQRKVVPETKSEEDKEFVPTEEISDDQPVAFPVDI